MQFISDLESVVLYFESIDKNYSCYAISNIHDFQTDKSNLVKISHFIGKSAIKYAIISNSYNFTFSDKQKTVNKKKFKFLTSTFKVPHEEKREIYSALWGFVKTYLKYFPTSHSNASYIDCYSNSLLIFIEIEAIITLFDFENPKSSRISLNDNIISNLNGLKRCIINIWVIL